MGVIKMFYVLLWVKICRTVQLNQVFYCVQIILPRKDNSPIRSMFNFLMTSLWGSQDAVTICTLGIGTAFGESILDNTPRHATIVTRESSELLRIEQKDFKALWEVSPKASLSVTVVAEKERGCHMATGTTVTS